MQSTGILYKKVCGKNFWNYSTEQNLDPNPQKTIYLGITIPETMILRIPEKTVLSTYPESSTCFISNDNFLEFVL